MAIVLPLWAITFIAAAWFWATSRAWRVQALGKDAQIRALVDQGRRDAEELQAAANVLYRVGVVLDPEGPPSATSTLE